METFYDSIILTLIICSLVMNYIIICKLDIFSNLLPVSIDEIEMRVVKISAQLTDIQEATNRSMLAREALEPAKPIKTNNWDSVRKAFKGPARVEIDE